jgi:hypothetical protein
LPDPTLVTKKLMPPLPPWVAAHAARTIATPAINSLTGHCPDNAMV